MDPNLTVRILRIVNSSYYGFHSEIETVSRAITVLGTRDLYNIVLAIAAVRSFSGLGAGLVSVERFWHHSLYGAVVAREIAKRCRFEEPERLFVAGLLHDVGSPVIYTQLPELASAMRGAADNDECALWHAEGLHLGFTHAHVGALLLEAWELPSRLLNAVLHHHDLQGPVDGAQESAALHLADGLASQVAAGAFFDGLSLESVVDPRAWEVLNLSPEVLSDENFAGSIETQFKELIAVFLRG